MEKKTSGHNAISPFMHYPVSISSILVQLDIAIKLETATKYLEIFTPVTRKTFKVRESILL